MLTREKLEPYLKQEGLEYYLDPENADRIVLTFQTNLITNVSLDIIIINNRTILFLSRVPLHIPQEHCAAVCEYISRVNFSVVLGGFELDFDEGILDYKIVGLINQNSELDFASFRRLLYLGNGMIDRYAPGILSILYRNSGALEAYQSITSQQK